MCISVYLDACMLIPLVNCRQACSVYIFWAALLRALQKTDTCFVKCTLRRQRLFGIADLTAEVWSLLAEIEDLTVVVVVDPRINLSMCCCAMETRGNWKTYDDIANIASQESRADYAEEAWTWITLNLNIDVRELRQTQQSRGCLIVHFDLKSLMWGSSTLVYFVVWRRSCFVHQLRDCMF